MIEPLTITEAAPMIRSGALTPSELLEQCLRRVDTYEPYVKAWVHLDRERARRDAAKLTEKAKTCYRGPLHGIPIGVKDIIDVFDMPTGCGSKLWANSYARRDAAVVERLRHAGAIILGKTVTTPYAFTDPPVTRNPWNLERTPGGSSSGSAAAVACGMCLGALGTQTGGSLIRPASYCGVYCLKPTWGRVSVDGVLPLASSLDHVGAMANCVRDLAILYEAMAGPVPPCVELVDNVPDEIKFIRLGEFFDAAEPEMLDLYRSAGRRIQSGSLEERTLPPGFARITEMHLTEMAVGAASTHRERFERRPDDYPPRIRELIELGLRAAAHEITRTVPFKTTLRERLQANWQDDEVFVTPATADFAPTPETTGRPVFNSPWSFLLFPVVSVPMGRSATDLPGAMQFVGKPDGEAHLLAAAASAERSLDVPRRLPPEPGLSDP